VIVSSIGRGAATMITITAQPDWLTRLNTRGHRAALAVFLAIVLAHAAEHVVQAFQIWALGWTDADAGGALGLWFPSLVSSEALHYAYAVVILAGLALLRPGFTGRARDWWTLALGIQIWHHFEHLILLIQAMTGSHLLGREVPTSVLQLFLPRVELHDGYNAAVLGPFVIAVILHLRQSAEERPEGACTCGLRRNRNRSAAPLPAGR
jgi:hypothetical protein